LPLVGLVAIGTAHQPDPPGLPTSQQLFPGVGNLSVLLLESPIARVCCTRCAWWWTYLTWLHLKQIS